MSQHPDHPHTQPGHCDLCGTWDGALIEGLCRPCIRRYAASLQRERRAEDQSERRHNSQEPQQ